MDKPAYFSGENAVSSYASEMGSNEDVMPIQRGVASAFPGRTFVGHDTNISVKSSYHRGDYDYFRANEIVPERKEEVVKISIRAYKKIGLVKNVIDLMCDFATQGIRIQHSVSHIQNFYDVWWDKVKGNERSERFLNVLLKSGTVIAKKNFGKLTLSDERKWRQAKAEGLLDDDSVIEKINTAKREIPLKYFMLSPLSVDVINGDLSIFTGKPILGLKISSNIKSAVHKGNVVFSRFPNMRFSDGIPAQVKKLISQGSKTIPLDPNRFEIFYYRKDDTQIWGDPIVEPILDDLILLNKMKLADSSALDGAISNIRLWTVGYIDEKNPNNSIFPTKGIINKLRNILANNIGGGVMDLVWGPELKFTESASQVWRFLGSEKYESTLNSIYDGLGIPAALRSGGTASNTGNFLGLNTLIKRLQYIRDILVSFWKKELKIVHKAMGFPGKPPSIVFDFMALADEAAEKQLLINLWDRDIISTETINELFGRNPEIERSRIKKETSIRGKKIPEKASPYHNPEKMHDYKKLLLQGGTVTPSEIGVQLEPKKDGEKTKMDIMEQMKVSNFKQSGDAGRPKNITETKKRKPKPTEKPSTNASMVNLIVWGSGAQGKISEIVNPVLLKEIGKSNLRQATSEEYKNIEDVKFAVFSNIEPYSNITKDLVYNTMKTNKEINENIFHISQELVQGFTKQNLREPSSDELKIINANAYATYHGVKNGQN